MRHLLDVNVLVALAWPNHVHHRAAQSWFAASSRAWASTPTTQSGFVRVCANPRAIPTAVSPGAAIAMWATMATAGDHAFLLDDVDGVLGNQVDPARVLGYRQVTDAHLLAVARRHGAALTTFDSGCLALADGAADVVVIST